MYTPSTKVEYAQFFQSLPTDQKGLYVVLVYAPWCGHCKTYVPQFVKDFSASSWKSKVHVALLDDKMGDSLLPPSVIAGYPSMFVYTEAGTVAPFAKQTGEVMPESLSKMSTTWGSYLNDVEQKTCDDLVIVVEKEDFNRPMTQLALRVAQRLLSTGRKVRILRRAQVQNPPIVTCGDAQYTGYEATQYLINMN